MRGRRRNGPGAIARAAAAALLLGGCTPLYLPPVPTDLPPIPERVRIADARVETVGGVPTVLFAPREVPAPGWLEVQWFPPAGGQAASASVRLEPASVGRLVRVPLPDDVARERAGRWRAVLSFEGRILRQVGWEEPGTALP